MVAANNIIIPPGMYFVDRHKNREGKDPALLDRIVTLANPAAPEQTERWEREGYLIDRRLGLPLHPRFMQLIRTFGMYAGPGFSFRYGPQRATNIGLRALEGDQVYYLLTKTYARNAWGLPGGYQDPTETLLEGAFREGREETGITFSESMRRELQVLSSFVPPSGVYRDTMHSWMEQYFYFVQAQTSMDRQAFGSPAPEDIGEIQAIKWATLEEIEQGIILGIDGLDDLPIMGSHRNQIRQNELALAA